MSSDLEIDSAINHEVTQLKENSQIESEQVNVLPVQLLCIVTTAAIKMLIEGTNNPVVQIFGGHIKDLLEPTAAAVLMRAATLTLNEKPYSWNTCLIGGILTPVLIEITQKLAPMSNADVFDYLDVLAYYIGFNFTGGYKLQIPIIKNIIDVIQSDLVKK
ncbi:MAG: hypothetical protein Q9M91_08845 [Candidatus Dojkabacteria bacterium]|nr:hypothetical protein [Candidatus Dojkabacteria bacterium]MDQ7021880.1 hypothetical protein [Candidatus Dojkabacteria bacterium]